MKPSGFIVAVVILQAGLVAEASGCGRMGHGRHRRVASQPRTTVYRAPLYQSPPITSPQMTSTQPTISRAPIASPTPPGEVQPSYNYASANQGRQSAYYYTYDNSGKLVVSRWVDYLFRGGRAEGMPRPPLPVIGALGGRNQ